MGNKNLTFKAGDWVILKESYIEKVYLLYGEDNGFLKIFSIPQKIKATHLSKKILTEQVLEFSTGRRWLISEKRIPVSD